MAKKSLKKQLRKENVRNNMGKRSKKLQENYMVAIADDDYYGTTVDASFEDYEYFNYQEETQNG